VKKGDSTDPAQEWQRSSVAELFLKRTIPRFPVPRTTERAELDALKSGDRAAFADLITEEVVCVDAAGPAPKPESVKQVAEFRVTDYTMSNIQFVPLSPPVLSSIEP